MQFDKLASQHLIFFITNDNFIILVFLALVDLSIGKTKKILLKLLQLGIKLLDERLIVQ